MRNTYEAILIGDQLTWIGNAPEQGGPVRVSIQIEAGAETSPRGHGPLVAERLRELASKTGGIRSIPDPLAWQREEREDRPLPGREP